MSPPAISTVTHRVVGTSEDSLVEVLGALARADESGAELHLDLSALDAGNAAHRRLDPIWLICVANVLLGKHKDVALRITLPHERGAQLQLQRNALYSAFAQRRGGTSYADIDEHSLQTLYLCKKPWSPRHGPYLFEEAHGEELTGITHLYTNTHQKAESGYFRRYDPSAAFRWLGKAIPRPAGVSSRVRERFVTGASMALLEVLDNFSRHAFNWLDVSFDAQWLSPGIVQGARSGLLASITRGGARSHDRLYFLAFDNGFGIARTMRWQHPHELALETAAEITERVLLERLSARGFKGHCGEGLWRLGELARVGGGRITVITEDDRRDGQEAVQIDVEVSVSGDEASLQCDHKQLQIPWRGTTIRVLANIPQPPSTSDDVRDRAEQPERESTLAQATA